MTTITIERELLEQVLNALLLPCDRWNGVQSRIVKEASDAVLSALAAPETAPEQPAWQDAPTVSGLWAHDGRIFRVFRPEVWGLDGRCYGPIPEDRP